MKNARKYLTAKLPLTELFVEVTDRSSKTMTKAHKRNAADIFMRHILNLKFCHFVKCELC